MSVRELCCHVATLCHAVLPHWDHAVGTHGQRRRQRSAPLAMSEIMTIVIYLHHMWFRDCKT